MPTTTGWVLPSKPAMVIDIGGDGVSKPALRPGSLMIEFNAEGRSALAIVKTSVVEGMSETDIVRLQNSGGAVQCDYELSAENRLRVTAVRPAAQI